MDTATGEIKTFETEEQLNAEQAKRLSEGKSPLVKLDQKPDPKCKKCWGRGHIGKDLKSGQFIPCKCVKKTNKTTKVQGAPVTTSSGW